MTKKIESRIKTALLNGEDYQSSNGWLIRVTAEDKVHIWPPKGEGMETTLAHLDSAIADFCKRADVYEPSVNETQGKPPKVTDGDLGKDTSTKDTKKLDAPEKSPRPKPQGPKTPGSLGKDTSTKPGFDSPAVNKRPKQTVNPGDPSLGPDSSGKDTNWGDKKVKIQEDGRTGRITDTFSNGPDASEIYRNLKAKRPSREMLEDIMDPEKWVANRVFAQMTEHKPKRGPGMPGKGKGTYADGAAGGQLGAGCEAEKEAVAPEGWEDTVKKMKDEPSIDNPWALAWSMKNKGYTPGGKDKKSKVAQSLDEFTMGYMEAALWSSGDGEEYESYESFDFEDIADYSRAHMISDCAKFQEENAEDLAIYYETSGRPADHAGHDFWLTRNGHGVGFWDRDGDEAALDRLTKASKKFGEEDLYLGDDGKLYIDGYEGPREAAHKQAGPKLREKWLGDGGYHREIESESAEELHALVRGFGGEDVDWSKFKPAMPEEDKEAADGVDPAAEAPNPSTQTAKKAQVIDQSSDVEAVDEEAKDVITKYMGDYGKELTKDEGIASKKDDPKKKLEKGKMAQAETPAPAATPAPQPSTPSVQQNPQNPAGAKPPTPPEQKKGPSGQQPLQPGVGDAGIQSLGWTKEDVQAMTDDQKQKILQVQLSKPGTVPKTQAPAQQKAPAPTVPKAPAPAQPNAPVPAPGAEPAPPAPAQPAPKAVKGGKGRKRSQAAPQAPEEEAPASAPQTPAAPVQKAPAAPQANPTTKPGAEGGDEQRAFQILQEVQKQPVEAATPNEISTAKASLLMQRLSMELGMGASEAAKLFGLPRGNLSALFK